MIHLSQVIYCSCFVYCIVVCCPVECPGAQFSLCIFPLALFLTTLTTSLCSALLFLLFSLPPPASGLFYRSPSPLSVSGCALTAIKRLPFMRNRSKDKDKAKAIYRRSMCKTSDSRHASLPLPPLPLIATLGETKTERSLMSGAAAMWGV